MSKYLDLLKKPAEIKEDNIPKIFVQTKIDRSRDTFDYDDFIQKLIKKKQLTTKFRDTVPVLKPKPKRKLTRKTKIDEDEEDDHGIGTDPEIKATTKTKSKSKKPSVVIKTKTKTTLVEPKKIDKIKKDIMIQGTKLSDRFSNEDKITGKTTRFYMNNRAKFITYINTLFYPYIKQLKKEREETSCEKRSESGKFSLLTHQRIVRDYMNIYSPYRGLLLYHGLGSGKTCSSIAIAEGLKSKNEIIIMTPASLKMNYYQELKKCGDVLFKENQFWERINTTKPENKKLIPLLAKKMNLSQDFVKRKGVWLINNTEKPNYSSLSDESKKSISKQVDMMISSKYKFIHYNGLNLTKIKKMTEDGKINPFDNKVIIIDEAHNLISRIVNQINRKGETIAKILYENLMSAKNCRIILLTGTPIINYPNEIGILFNILRGYIKTYNYSLNIRTERKVDEKLMREIFKKSANINYLEYKPSSNTLILTQLPFNVENTIKNGQYNGVKVNLSNDPSKSKNKTDEEFNKYVIDKLKDKGIFVLKTTIDNYKALPDNLDEFNNLFINKKGEVINYKLLQKRIVGLTSYFRSAQEELMPSYNKETDFIIEKIPMSDHQFTIYEKARQNERKNEKKKPKKTSGLNIKNIYDEVGSTYKIFSRLFCNFVFPTEYPRPLKSNITKDIDQKVLIKNEIDIGLEEEETKVSKDEDTKFKSESVAYKENIGKAMKFMSANKSRLLNKESLSTLSPKFLKILNNINDADKLPVSTGSHLIYSQFKTIEGLGMFHLVLSANGFVNFKIRRNKHNKWLLNMKEEDIGKKSYVLYSGDQTEEEKEILRNIFNSNWKKVPTSISKILRSKYENNNRGELIKVFMITASGAEGISLKNIRYVHIMEPYWHPVRIQQVIGRARRICSHEELDESMRNVKVYLYLMILSEEQKTGDGSTQLQIYDRSKLDKTKLLTTDETLFEISTIKEDIANKLLKSVKESSIDCEIHSDTSTEDLVCLSLGDVKNDDLMTFVPDYKKDGRDKDFDINIRETKWKGKKMKSGKNEYIMRLNKDGKNTNLIYDYASFKRSQKDKTTQPIFIGYLKKVDGVYKITSEK
jgi:hypothetical protein